MKPYPLVFTPILKEKVWGGRELERLGKALPEHAKIGESWELADLPATSSDGGGGGESRSVIASGEMRGLTLGQAIVAMGPNLMGTLRPDASTGGFPLLVKYLDARENLSVQVHPSPAYAAAHPGAHLKTESWFVVSAAPGAVIYKGLKQGVTRRTVAEHAKSGAIVDDLLAVPARAGDFHHLPSGTCHALGAGVVVAEVQTPSDTTYRLFDWGRAGRALHLDQALDCLTYGPPARLAPIRAEGGRRSRLAETDHYGIWQLSMLGGEDATIENFPAPPIGGPMVWMCTAGEGRIESRDGSFKGVPFKTGDTLLFPAALGPALASVARDATILEVRFPSRT